MALTKAKLGAYLEQSDARNTNNLYDENAVVGLSTHKEIIKTKANLDGVDLKSYKLLAPNQFAYVPDTSRRGDMVALAYNSTQETYLVSAIYTVFYVSNPYELASDYLFMYFNRPEFDRYARMNSWGSARETFSWEEMCDIDIDLPDIEAQKKVVDVYLAMLANQQSYERGLEDLKLTCDAYIEDLRRKMPCEKIGTYISESDKRNDIGLPVESVRGLSTGKEIIETVANMDGVSLSGYKVVAPRQIAFVPDTSRRGDKMALGFNDTDKCILVSSIYTVFETDVKNLLPEYLMLFLTRSEFDRYARYNSWGSARETFVFADMCDVNIPIPDIGIQQALADLFYVQRQRKSINDRLKAQIKDICPVLIRGSLAMGGN